MEENYIVKRRNESKVTDKSESKINKFTTANQQGRESQSEKEERKSLHRTDKCQMYDGTEINFN